MRKIPTLFVRDPNNRARVIDQVTEGCEWVINGEGIATRKYDGTCVLYFDLTGTGRSWWARREVKPMGMPPENFWAISTDTVTGKTMGWEPIEQSSFAKYHAEALRMGAWYGRPGTYELCGPKINGNPEGFDLHCLIAHSEAMPLPDAPCTFETLREWLAEIDIEGIVWDRRGVVGRMCKIKKRDFGLIR